MHYMYVNHNARMRRVRIHLFVSVYKKPQHVMFSQSVSLCVLNCRINTQVQRANLGTELLREECCPVCEEEEEGEEEDTCCNKVFKFISGESFLLSLHITGQ